MYRALESDDSDSKRVKDAQFREDSWIERRMIEGEVVKPEENARATEVENPFLNPSSQAFVPKSQEAENPFVASSSQALVPQTSRTSPADMQDTSVTTGNSMDRHLDEDDFYKEANKDLESRLDDIDPDEDRMADLVIGALKITCRRSTHLPESMPLPRNMDRLQVSRLTY